MADILNGKIHIIACATVAEELIHLGVPESKLTELEFGLHNLPQKLKTTLQAEIDKIDGVENILLGYGLCANAVIGLCSKTCRLIIPKLDDCISLFLGSTKERLKRLSSDPGTFYLTKGWIKAGIDELKILEKRYGNKKAIEVRNMMLKNYSHLTLINTGNYRINDYRSLACEEAESAGLRFKEIPGSNRILKKMIKGEWDSEFIIAEPGEEIFFQTF